MKNINLHLTDRLELSTYEELVFDIRFPTYNTMVRGINRGILAKLLLF